MAQKKWGPALLPAPTAPSEGYAGIRNLVRFGLSAQPDPLSILAHQLRRRFPPDRSLLRGARPIYSTAPPESSLAFRPVRPVHEDPNPEELQPSGQSRPMFRGPSWGNRSHVPLRSPKSRRTPEAASHKRQFPLPAPLPGWPRKEPKLFPLPAGGDRFFCPFLARSTVAGFPGRLGLPPRSQESPCACHPSRGSEKYGTKPVDNGDIGNKARNLLRLPESRLLTTSAKCLNPLPSSPIQPISRA